MITVRETEYKMITVRQREERVLINKIQTDFQRREKKINAAVICGTILCASECNGELWREAKLRAETNSKYPSGGAAV